MRITDLRHLTQGNMKGQMPFHQTAAGNTQPYSLHLEEATNSFNTGINSQIISNTCVIYILYYVNFN